MKKFMQMIQDSLTDAALLEMGVPVVTPEVKHDVFHETLEEKFIEVAFAESDVYDQIHEAILLEHWSANDAVHPDGCLFCEKEHCFA